MYFPPPFYNVIWLQDLTSSSGHESSIVVEDDLDQPLVPSEDTSPGTQSTLRAAGNKRLFKSPIKGQGFTSKRTKHSATDEALAIMKDIRASNTTVRDQYTVFGEQVGMRIRDLPSSYAKLITKQLISNVLFDAEVGKYDNPSTCYPPPSAHSPQVPYHAPPTVIPLPRSFQNNSCVPQPGPSHYGLKSAEPFASPPSRGSSCYDTESNDSDTIDKILMDL